MNILSLFDGISCGQVALNRNDIKYDNYFASEIEVPAMNITNYNFPKTKQVGDITKLKGSELPQIDLLFGGSPCQSFSNAGRGAGFDGSSGLFWEYVRLLEETKPKYFLLENVVMKKDWEDIITKAVGVDPILINSSSFSAQDRKRLYWTNIDISSYENRNIYFKDILETNPDNKLFLRKEVADRYQATINYKKDINKSCVIGKLSKYQGDRVFDIDCKGSSLSAGGGNNGGGGCNIIFDPTNGGLRRISTLEAERLQTLPDHYTKIEKDSNRYKSIGNGWTVDVISHIFKNI
jgi:DNA-cytosine methyltransferase